MAAHPIDTLGFRPPQFSEDLAWLPGWLQQHQIEQFDECIKKLTGTNSELECKDMKVSQGKSSKGNYADTLSDTLSRGEDRIKSYKLFLSGEDNTPAGIASALGNVLHFHLCLSSTGFSQCSPTQPQDASQNHLKSNRVSPTNLSDTSAGSKDESCSEMGLNLGGRDLLPLNSIQKSMEDVGPQCPSNDRISAMHIRKKYNVRNIKATDMAAAAELSIAASEALVIHETVSSGIFADALPTEVVLEAALQVKRARLDWSVDAFDSLADESDSLSDLDDLTMADVYEDVGLSHSIPFDDHIHGSAISVVQETPLSEQQREFVNLCDPVELEAQPIEFDDMSAQRQQSEIMVMDISKDNVPPAPFNDERQEFYANLVPGLNICNVARYNHSALKNSEVLAKKQRIDPRMVDVNVYQPKKEVNIHPHACNSGNARDDRVGYLVSDRFRSRWLGGWTGQSPIWKEASAIRHMEQNTRNIVKCFVGETSFLSESADIAPDMNSFVQVHETESHRMSQSSIHCDLFSGETNQGVLLSQDVVRSSSPSLVDPLCSVVPCSIPSENEVPTLAQSQRDKKNHTEKCFRPTTELGMGNPQKPSNLIIEFHHENGQSTPAINGEDSPVTVRRQFISLKTYSTLHPNPVSNGGSLYQSIKLDCDQRLITLDQTKGCIRSSDRSRKASLPFKPISEHLSSRDIKENGKMISNGSPVVKMKYQKRKYNETTGDVDQLSVQASKKRRQSVSFNHRAQFHLQTSKSFVNNSTGEGLPKPALVPENVVELQENKELQSIPYEQKSLHCTAVPAKKRVHFSEIPVQQNKKPTILDIPTKNWLTDRARKQRKYSNSSKFQNHEKCWRTNSRGKDGKRLLFQGIQFLLTGFLRQKEKHLEGQIWKHGGIVLFDIPSPNSRANRSLKSNDYQLPIILCSKKLQTTKFLYGCAVNAFILKDDWLTDSISAGYIVPPEQYIILRNEAAAECISIGKSISHKRLYVFDRVGIMLHGKQSFGSKLGKLIKHGGGQVFKTLQRLILDLEKEKISWGAIVSEDEKTSRHLRHCATEQKIPIMVIPHLQRLQYLGPVSIGVVKMYKDELLLQATHRYLLYAVVMHLFNHASCFHSTASKVLIKSFFYHHVSSSSSGTNETLLH